ILGSFGSPALTEGINGSISFLNCSANIMFQLIAEIVVRTRQTGRQRPHIKAIEKISANKIQGITAGGALQRRETRLQIRQVSCNRMLKIVIDQKQQIGWAILRFDIDCYAIVLTAS